MKYDTFKNKGIRAMILIGLEDYEIRYVHSLGSVTYDTSTLRECDI